MENLSQEAKARVQVQRAASPPDCGRGLRSRLSGLSTLQVQLSSGPRLRRHSPLSIYDQSSVYTAGTPHRSRKPVRTARTYSYFVLYFVTQVSDFPNPVSVAFVVFCIILLIICTRSLPYYRTGVPTFMNTNPVTNYICYGRVRRSTHDGPVKPAIGYRLESKSSPDHQLTVPRLRHQHRRVAMPPAWPWAHAHKPG